MSQITCPNCHSNVSRSYRFCPDCGADLDDAQSESKPDSTVTASTSETSEVSRMRIEMDDNLSMEQIERLGRLMAGIDFTSANSAQAVERALKQSMPDLKLQDPVITGTSKTITITSRGNVETNVLGDLSGGSQPDQTASLRTCHQCGSRESEEVRFCMSCGADMDSPPSHSAPTISNDWAQPSRGEAKSGPTAKHNVPLLLGILVVFLTAMGLSAMYYLSP